MAMQHLENELRRTGDPRKQAFADVIAGIHKSLGSDIPFPANGTAKQAEAKVLKTPKAPVISKTETAKMYPEISLEEERERQIKGFIGLGFHTKLGKTEEEYAMRFPRFTSQPKSFKGRMDTPVLVETEISPKDQCELAGIPYFLDGLSKTDWNQSLKGYTTPKAPYAAWLDDGRNHMNKKVKDVRSNLKSDEIGGTELDGIDLYISNRKIVEHHLLDLPGTSVGSDDAASLSLWGGRPRLDGYFVGVAAPRFGSVVRGRQK